MVRYILRKSPALVDAINESGDHPLALRFGTRIAQCNRMFLFPPKLEFKMCRTCSIQTATRAQLPAQGPRGEVFLKDFARWLVCSLHVVS
jgi:hypothetical protein